MQGFKALQTYFNQILDKEKLIREPEQLYKPIEYTIRLGGKRLRPVLCLAGCELFCGSHADALQAAIGLELFHNFTLLHDDIMDESPIRRGHPTVYKKWDSNVAILSGDTMFAVAYEYVGKIAADKLPGVLPIFTKTAIEVCEGQQYDMEFEDRMEVSKEEYIEMIRLKTAVLLAGSLKIGAMIGGASAEDAEKIYDFGLNLGLAFQLKDDLLDTYADQDVFGKRTGNDIITNKKTFLIITALQNANPQQRAKLIDYYSGENKYDDAEKIAGVMQIFEALHIKEETERVMISYQQKAIAALDAIGVEENRKSLLFSIVEYLQKREV